MYPNHRCTNSGVHVGKNVNMSTIATSVSTTAITGSSRSSSSVASESLGGIDITHEEGRNSDAGGGGAYLEVSGGVGVGVGVASLQGWCRVVTD